MSQGNLLELFNKEQQAKLSEGKSFPEFRPGYVVSVEYFVQGSDSRTQVFTGLCIGKKNRGLHSGFLLRKLSANDIYVEKRFNLYSPSIKSITIGRKGKVRRAKLYYIRALAGKSARISKEYRD